MLHTIQLFLGELKAKRGIVRTGLKPFGRGVGATIVYIIEIDLISKSIIKHRKRDSTLHSVINGHI